MSAPIPTPIPKLTTVHLVGSLGRAIGHTKLELDVFSVAEALRAIDIITNGAFFRYLSGPAKDKLYKVAIQRKDNVVGREELNHRSGRGTIYIMPTVRGRNSGGLKVVAGAILTAIGAYFKQTWLMQIGISLMVGGVAQLLTPSPSSPPPDKEMAQSRMFQGNTAAVVQGGPIPVVYGRSLVPAVPISITVENSDVSITDAGTLGGVNITRLGGGSTQYDPE